MKIGSFTGCHQLFNRSFSYKGYQFPVCARCTGLFVGQFLSFIFAWFLLNYSVNILFVFAVVSTLPLAVDGTCQLYGLWESTNLRRFFTGIICGFATSTFFIKLLTLLF